MYMETSSTTLKIKNKKTNKNKNNLGEIICTEWPTELELKIFFPPDIM